MIDKKFVNASYGVFIIMLIVVLIVSVWTPDYIGVHYTGNVADGFINK